jgi:hypothetical protein
MKNVRWTLFLVVSGILSFFMGCAKPMQTMLEDPIEEIRTVSEKGEGISVQLNPKVDILFVIDNSKSMETHQKNLEKNIDKFVNALNKDKGVEYNIGVVSVFDSIRMPDLDVRNFDRGKMLYPKGHLRPLVNTSGEKQVLGPHYVTPATPDGLATLGRTLKIGVHDYVNNCDLSQKNTLDCGPEFEESFSPVLASLTEPLTTVDAHAGFYRGTQAHFVVIFVTDAQDSSPNLTGSQFLQTLRALRSDVAGGESSFSLFGILPNTPGCKVDYGGGPDNIKNLVSMAQGHILDLCTDFGNDLADLGTEIRSRTIKRRIRLSSKPEFGSIQVKYGDMIIPNNSIKGWTLDNLRNEIVIHGTGDAEISKDVILDITYRPVNLGNMSNGHASGI